MFVLTILEKMKISLLKVSQGSVTVLEEMANYEDIRVKVKNAKLNKLNFAAKYKT